MRTIYKVLVILIFVLYTNEGSGQAPNWAWAKSMDGTNSDAIGFSIAIDNAGNIYTTGRFRGTVDFDPGSLTYNLTAVAQTDIYISKSNASGDFLWARAIGGSYYDGGYSIAVDTSGNVYTTGYFTSTVDFDPGPGVFNLTAFPLFINDIFVSKLDSNGIFVWAKQMAAGQDDCIGMSISVDAINNLLITGHFSGYVDFDPDSIGTFILTSYGEQDIFICKLDSGGNFIWAKQIGGYGDDNAYSLALDDSGNIYTTGSYKVPADFDPGIGIFILNGLGAANTFVSKLDSSGNFVWAKSLEGLIASDAGISIKLDPLGNIYFTGYFSATIDFDPGSGTYFLTSGGYEDVFIVKLNNNGNFIWAKSLSGGDYDSGNSIAVDNSGNAFTVGSFEGTVDFDPGVGMFNLTSAGLHDIFVSKLDSSGNFVWAKSVGSGNYDAGYSCVLNATGNLFVTGWFYNDTISFDTIVLANVPGGSNIFISKLDTAIITGMETLVYNSDVSIFPNPVTTNCTINAPGCVNAILTLYDITGRVMLQQAFNEKETVDMDKLKAGMYVMEIWDKEGRSVKGKVVKN